MATRRWQVLAALGVAVAAATVRGDGFDDILSQTPQSGGPQAEMAFNRVLQATVEKARETVKAKTPGAEATRVVATLRGIAPMMREEQQRDLDEWMPMAMARFGETDHALAAIQPGREQLVVKVLGTSFDACMANKDLEAARNIATRLHGLLAPSAGTMGSPGLFEATTKAWARLGDSAGVSLVAKLVEGPQAAALRVLAVRLMVQDKALAAAERIAAEMRDPLARYDAYAAIGLAREQAGELALAALDFEAAMRAREKANGTPAIPPMLTALGIYRSGGKTLAADLYVSDLDALQKGETKTAMLEITKDPAVRLRVAAAFHDVLLVGEEAMRLGKKADGAKMLQSWLAAEPPIKRVRDVLGAAGAEEPTGPSGIPGKIDRLVRAGRALGTAEAKEDAQAALKRAADAVELVATQRRRPDWMVEVGIAQAAAGLKEDSAASIAKALEWANMVPEEEGKMEMRARVALAQVAAGDIEGARKTAELMAMRAYVLNKDIKLSAVVTEVWPAIGVAEIRAKNRDAGEAAFKNAVEEVSEPLKPGGAAAVVAARMALGETALAVDMLKEYPHAPVSNATLSLLAALLVKNGKTGNAVVVVGIGLPEHSPQLGERVKLTAIRLKDARQYRAAITAVGLAAEDVKPEIIAAIYTLAADNAEGAFLAENVRGDEVSVGERLAAVRLAKTGDREHAVAIIKKLVAIHAKESALHVKHPALIADGMAFAAIGEKSEAAKIGLEEFKWVADRWLLRERPWKDAWLKDAMGAATTLRVCAGDYEGLIKDIGTIPQEGVRMDLAALVVHGLLTRTGPMGTFD